MLSKKLNELFNFSQLIFFGVLCFIFIVSALVQSQVLMSWDVSWGIHEARRFLAGGTYGKEIFEATPPIFLYLYSPAIWLSDIFHLSVATAMRLYLAILSAIFLLICYPTISSIFAKNSRLKAIMFLAIAAAFVLLPLPYDTGQREHLVFLLTMPYFLLMVNQLENFSSTHPMYRILVGGLAGLGFAIKPFFILPFLCAEGYYALQKRNLFAWFRLDSLGIILIALIQVVSLCIWHPDYFTKIAPLFWQFYYQGYSSNLQFVLFHPAMLFCEFVLLFFLIEYQTNPYQQLTNVFLIAMIGFAITHVLQRTFWYYHLYPAFSYGMLLTVLFYSLFVTRRKEVRDYVAACVLILFLMLMLFANIPDFIVTLVGFRFATAIFLTSILIFLVSLLSSSEMPIQFNSLAFLSFFGMIIFIFPYHFAHTRFLLAEYYKEKMQPLITFLHDNAEAKPVYFFSTAMSVEFPAVDYGRAIHVSRYPALIWVPGLLNQTQQTLNFKTLPQLEKINRYFVSSVADEIERYKPAYIFIDTQSGYYLEKPFSYIDYFSANQSFKTNWQSYRYLTTIDGGEFFQFKVYERV